MGQETNERSLPPPRIFNRRYILLRGLCLSLASVLFLSPQVSCGDVVREEGYRDLFNRYLRLVESAAERKDVQAVSAITDRFEKEYRSYRLAQVFVWHLALDTENKLLFHKVYWGDNYPLPKIQWKDRDAIHVYLADNFALVDYAPKDSRVRFRLVFSR